MKKQNATARKCSCEKLVPRPVTKGFQTFKTGKKTGVNENLMLDTAKPWAWFYEKKGKIDYLSSVNNFPHTKLSAQLSENDLKDHQYRQKLACGHLLLTFLLENGTPWQVQQWFCDVNTCLRNLPIQSVHISLVAHKKRALTTKVSNRLSLGTKIIASPGCSLCTCKSSISISCVILSTYYKVSMPFLHHKEELDI